ncbi:YdbH domain-containing protein [Pyruvatibacter sp.]|uniref:YdbH domain-containing protein n=1 Tax=Pyruvatibacter sp. TaxID=1981328 RepID=UPI0032639843
MTSEDDQITSSGPSSVEDKVPAKEAEQPRRGILRRIRWWVLGLFVVLGLGVAGLVHYLPSLARPIVQSAAADLGLVGLDLQFDEISWRKATLSNVTVVRGGEADDTLSVGRVDLTYTPLDLWAGRIGTVSLRDLVLRGRLVDGAPDFGALNPLIDQLTAPGDPSTATEQTAVPLDRVDLSNATLFLTTPDGDVEVGLDGFLDVAADTSGLAAGFDVRLSGDLASGGGRIDATSDVDGQILRITSLSLESDHGRLPGKISLSGVNADMRVGDAGNVEASIAGDLAFAEHSGQPLPVTYASAPVDLTARFDLEEGSGSFSMRKCMPIALKAAADAVWKLEDLRLCPADAHPVLSIDVASTSLRSDFSLMPARINLADTLNGMLPQMDATIRQGADGQVVASLAVKGGDLTLPQQALRLENISADATVAPGRAGQLGRLDIDRVRVTDTQAAKRFAPVEATASLSLDGLGEDGLLASRLKGPVTIKTPAGVVLTNATLSHGLASGEGQLDFKTGPLTFAEDGLQPQELAPVLLGVVAAVSGEVSASGTIAWDNSGVRRSSARTELVNVGLQASAARFAQVSGDIEFSSLVPVRTRGTQAVSIGVLDAGLPLEGGIALVRVEGGGDVIIENAQWPFAGGQLVLTSGALNTRADVQRAELAALSVNLTELLNLVEMEGLSGEGVLGGAVPIEIRDGSVYVTQAKLAAEPGGVVRYQNASTDAAGQTAEGANIAFQALENFHFQVLSLEIDGPVDGELTLKITLQGANPDLLEGYPVHLNISTQGAFLDLLRRGTVGFRALDVVTGKENLDGLSVERVGPEP